MNLNLKLTKLTGKFLEFLYSNVEDIRTLLRIRDSIVLLEQLADRIHDISDLMRILIYS